MKFKELLQPSELVRGLIGMSRALSIRRSHVSLASVFERFLKKTPKMEPEIVRTATSAGWLVRARVKDYMHRV
jgi:hypothetical protein